MLSLPCDDRQMRAVFGLLREAVITLAGDERAALYSPVAARRKDSGFKLHADLFITTRIWLIFDDVPDDGTGASLFLSRRDLLQAIRSIDTIPNKVAGDVTALMTAPVARDSFEKLYWLLHSEQRRWHDDLNDALQERVKTIALHRGEGYLMDDRRWLHGRTPASGAVSALRFHRLAFGLRGRPSVAK